MQSTIVGALHPLVERDLRLLELLAEEVGAQTGSSTSVQSKAPRRANDIVSAIGRNRRPDGPVSA